MTQDPHPTPLADAVERIAASVVGLALRRGSAAGVVWQDGIAVTSAAAVWRAHRIAVVLPGGEQVDGTLRGADPGTDIAAIAFDGGSAALAPAARADVGAAPPPPPPSPRVGDVVFAAGREPSGQLQASFGHIGAVGGEWRTWRGGRVERLIRLDGGLYPGLAGAVVAGPDARAIGIASAMFSRQHGVVLPLATIDRVLAQLLAHGRVSQGHAGVAVQPVRAQLNGAAVDGLLVSSVADDGPAATAGLLVGDVIVTAAGQPVASLEALRAQLVVGADVALSVVRGGQAMTLQLRVADRPQPRGGGCGERGGCR